MERLGVMIHESAYVDEPCEIGAGTRIWHFSHVMSGARIGERCNLGQNVVVAEGVTLGNNVKVQNNVSIYTGVTLEDDVFCGPSMVFTNVVNPRSEISRREEFQKTIVRCGATLGANCTVVCGVEIGRFAFVGAGAVITDDVPPYSMMVGVPARRAGWVCRCGARLHERAAEAAVACGECGNQYRDDGSQLKVIREVQGGG
jgi:UDP-2-acetamido-3-amino-2,3-dideoxy-glucuronate N-acetyltransferase